MKKCTFYSYFWQSILYLMKMHEVILGSGAIKVYQRRSKPFRNELYKLASYTSIYWYHLFLSLCHRISVLGTASILAIFLSVAIQTAVSLSPTVKSDPLHDNGPTAVSCSFQCIVIQLPSLVCTGFGIYSYHLLLSLSHLLVYK